MLKWSLWRLGEPFRCWWLDIIIVLTTQGALLGVSSILVLDYAPFLTRIH
jgi:hypothetical protein